MASIRYQVELFWLALGFFSRLPIPNNTPYSESRMNQAGRYFALIGVLLGLLCACVYWVTGHVFSNDIALFLTMCFSLMLTGAFHEDGLTDMADGIGGGMTIDRRLAIMKDSRIGTYGGAALVMALLGKFILLSELSTQTNMFAVFIVGYTLSRATAASLIFDTPYVSDTDTSKSKPLASRQSKGELALLTLTGALPCFWFDSQLAMLLIAMSLAFRLAFQSWINKRLGGFTGDCLGGAQQLMELITYLTIIGYFGYVA